MYVDFIQGRRVEVLNESETHHRRPYRVRVDGELLMAKRQRGTTYPLMFASRRAALQRARAFILGRPPARPTRMQLETALSVLQVRLGDLSDRNATRALGTAGERFVADLECVLAWLRHLAQGAK